MRMLSSNGNRESLAGKLLLSSALVAVTLVYGWWQRHSVPGPTVAMAPVPQPLSPRRVAAIPRSAVPAPAPMATHAVIPDPKAMPGPDAAPNKTTAAPPPQSIAAKATPRPPVVSAEQEPQPPSPPSEAPLSSTASPSLTPQQAMQMNLPMDGASPPLPMATGTPEPGAGSPVPAGAHLEDGDYVSDRQELAWGDLKVKISIHGGVITAVQILQYPDHRSQSLYLSQMAGPALESEVIKSQKAQVDVVSSATDTSYSFQDTVANAIMKATRE